MLYKHCVHKLTFAAPHSSTTRTAQYNISGFRFSKVDWPSVKTKHTHQQRKKTKKTPVFPFCSVGGKNRQKHQKKERKERRGGFDSSGCTFPGHLIQGQTLKKSSFWINVSRRRQKSLRFRRLELNLTAAGRSTWYCVEPNVCLAGMAEKFDRVYHFANRPTCRASVQISGQRQQIMCFCCSWRLWLSLAKSISKGFSLKPPFYTNKSIVHEAAHTDGPLLTRTHCSYTARLGID